LLDLELFVFGARDGSEASDVVETLNADLVRSIELRGVVDVDVDRDDGV
jgi:hypothetical protein